MSVKSCVVARKSDWQCQRNSSKSLINMINKVGPRIEPWKTSGRTWANSNKEIPRATPCLRQLSGWTWTKFIQKHLFFYIIIYLFDWCSLPHQRLSQNLQRGFLPLSIHRFTSTSASAKHSYMYIVWAKPPLMCALGDRCDQKTLWSVTRLFLHSKIYNDYAYRGHLYLI